MVLSVLLMGCFDAKSPPDPDGDGYTEGEGDCAPDDAGVHPGAVEDCDQVDSNCSGDESDATDAVTWYADVDGDGVGGDVSIVTNCEVRMAGYVVAGGDCDDEADAVHPQAVEVCNQVDDDCDGLVDDDAADAPTWYLDADTDGFGDPGAGLAACLRPDGYLADATDCDDTTDAVHPGADEVCNQVDDDCDAVVDEDDAVDALPWYADADVDGFGDAAVAAIACAAPEAYVADATDCDDARADVFPGAEERCDGVDDDCDAAVDEAGAVDEPTWYLDADADGYGRADITAAACDTPTGFVADAADCDDLDASTNPGAEERCGGGDEDCDGVVDEDAAADASTWYADADADGYGDATLADVSCLQPSGHVADATDCDDTRAASNPGAVEYCNGIDDDCDAETDEDASADAATWYADTDADGYGDSAGAYVSCSSPAGYVAVDGDCDDGEAAVHPDATDVCDDGMDDDCDGTVDGGCGPHGDLLPGDADLRLLGEVAGDGAGVAVTGGVDLTGDGWVDVVVGANVAESTAGAAYVVPGGTSGDADLATFARVQGPGGGYGVGDHLAVGRLAGDFDGDGDDDLMVESAGAPFVMRGPLVGTAIADSASSDYLAYWHPGGGGVANVAMALGDLDGSGTADAVIGSPEWCASGSCTYGAVYIDLGPASGERILTSEYTTRLAGTSSVERVGRAVATGGDADGDGLEDLLTASNEGGSAWLVCDPAAGDFAMRDVGVEITPARASDYAGHDVALVPDADGDGYDDLLLGGYGDATNGAYAGAAYLVYGPLTATFDLSAPDATLLGESAGMGAGWSVDGGDISADGVADLIVGSMDDVAWVVYGPVSGSIELLDADARITGPADGTGADVAVVGDFLGTGYGNLLVGASEDDTTGTNAGAAWLFDGGGG